MSNDGAGHDETISDRVPVSALTLVGTAFLIGVAGFAIAMVLAPWQAGVLVGWIVAALALVLLIWTGAARLGHEATRRRATRDDRSRPLAEQLLLIASWASLPGVGAILVLASEEEGGAEAALVAIASLALVLSWLVVHTVYAMRYARRYYLDGEGIDFKDTEPPDYMDFAYFAFTVGMTYQVSDSVVTTKAVRRTALRHALISFVFGTGVLAVTINIVATLFAD